MPGARHIGRILPAFLAMLVSIATMVTLPVAAQANANEDIEVEQVQIGEGTGEGGQLVIGDRVVVKGEWDASNASPEEGDTFTITLPPELGFDTPLPIQLTGADGTVWAECLTDPSTNSVTCTLTDAVTDWPELVHGTFEFEVDVMAATTETEVVFNLNGTDVPVELPGGGGIDDGIEIPDTWGKSGWMQSNNWSMVWAIDLPGSRLAGHDVVNIGDTLSDNHKLCEPANLRVETVRGGTVIDVTEIHELLTTDTGDYDFVVRLNAPEAGFDSNVTYRITYETCTLGNQIDAPETEYTNEAFVDIWGEGSGIIGVNPAPWHEELTKSGSVLGGGDRNGKIGWTVTVPGDQLVNKDGFTFTETLGSGHEVCTDTIDNISITERYGPSDQLQGDITSKLTAGVAAQSAQGFEINYTINDSDFEFKPSDYRYRITYTTCVSQTDLPEGGTKYTNEASVDGKVAGTTAEVPGRTDDKRGSINSGARTLDGVEHLPQTTIDWNITVPGERLSDFTGDLVVTDKLSGAHEVCRAGDGGGLGEQLGLVVTAVDQISGGGLDPVDLTDSVSVSEADGQLTFTLPEPTLPLPQGGEATGFSKEYQYVFQYTTCTTSGGMDAPGTTYGNEATVAGKEYTSSAQQNNRGSGTGTGVARGSVEIEKTLAETPGAEFVPDGTTFSVHVEEIDPDGTVQIEYDLEIPLNGEPVSGLNSRGNGWTIRLSEPNFPSVPGVVFGAPTFKASDGVTPSTDGTTAIVDLEPGNNISVSLENIAELGQVSLEKLITGGASDLVDPSTSYEVTATIDTSALGDDFPAQADREVTVVPGTATVLKDLPIGAVVTFSETVPADDDQLTWGSPVFSPENIEVTGEHVDAPAAVTLTNSVERTLGTFSIVKEVTGEQADNPAVPDAVEITAEWNEEGEEGSKTLMVPTDGTPVPLGEDLLIGTEVTLTEAPLADGSSIAWGAPTWSGDGVVVDGGSAIVTIDRDAESVVHLENHAATSVAGVSLLKAIAGEAAEDVDPDTEFPVTATWSDEDGDHEVDLMINAVDPTPLGIELPAGTIVTITEGERPGIDTVIWDSITFSGDVQDNGDGSAELVISDQQGDVSLVTVTNEATWAPGTFGVVKNVTGVLLDDPNVPDSVDVVATWIEDGEEVSETLTVPTDGTRVAFGTDLPHGTEVTLAEESLTDNPAFTWDVPVWDADGITAGEDGTATFTIGAAVDLDIALTNTATALLGDLTIVKELTGDGASAVDSGTVFPVTATWTDLLGEQQQVELEVTAGEPAVLEGLPLGTDVLLTEGETDLPAGVEWVGATWSSDAENVTVTGDGTEVTVVVTGEAGAEAEVTLENEFEEEPEMPATGVDLGTVGLIGLALTLLAAGAAVFIMRRRNA